MSAHQDSISERVRPVTVVLVDDEQLVRSALAQALAADGVDLLGEATNASDALRLVLELRPDVVLMDLKLPGSHGVETIEALGLLAPASRILILTRTEQNRVVEAIVAGASGYILKSANPGAIIAAVRATAAGESVISSEIAGKLLQRIRERDIPITTDSDDAASAIRATLTPANLKSSPAWQAARAITRSRAISHSAPTRSPTTSPASSPSSTSTTASRRPSKPCAAVSPEPLPDSAAAGE